MFDYFDGSNGSNGSESLRYPSEPLTPHLRGNRKYLGRKYKSSTEEMKNSSEVSFHSSEVLFHSSEVLFPGSVENFHFPPSYSQIPP